MAELNIPQVGPDRLNVGLSTPYDSYETLHYLREIQASNKNLPLLSYYLLGICSIVSFIVARVKDLLWVDERDMFATPTLKKHMVESLEGLVSTEYPGDSHFTI